MDDKDRLIASLKLNINDLREALEEITNTDPDEGTQWFHSKAEQALAITPAQHINDDVIIFTKDSLQEHDNEVIEMVASACTCGCDDCPDNIRALKVT